MGPDVGMLGSVWERHADFWTWNRYIWREWRMDRYFFPAPSPQRTSTAQLAGWDSVAFQCYHHILPLAYYPLPLHRARRKQGRDL